MGHTRRVNLFADPKTDGVGSVIGNTLRWLVDMDATQTDVTFSRLKVKQSVFMTKWHEYSWVNGNRKSHNRSSFQNNVGPYTHGEHAVLAVSALTPCNPDGSPMTKRRYVRRYGHRQVDTAPNGTPIWQRYLVSSERKDVPVKGTNHVWWIGPSVDEWFATMTPKHLDAALAMLERRLLKFVDDDADEFALTTRWMERVRGAMSRKSAAS